MHVGISTSWVIAIRWTFSLPSCLYLRWSATPITRQETLAVGQTGASHKGTSHTRHPATTGACRFGELPVLQRYQRIRPASRCAPARLLGQVCGLGTQRPPSPCGTAQHANPLHLPQPAPRHQRKRRRLLCRCSSPSESVGCRSERRSYFKAMPPRNHVTERNASRTTQRRSYPPSRRARSRALCGRLWQKAPT